MENSKFVPTSNKFIDTITCSTALIVGPYTDGKIVNKDANFVYTAGQLGIDPVVIKLLLKNYINFQ